MRKYSISIGLLLTVISVVVPSSAVLSNSLLVLGLTLILVGSYNKNDRGLF